jgi:hypothetical protein
MSEPKLQLVLILKLLASNIVVRNNKMVQALREKYGPGQQETSFPDLMAEVFDELVYCVRQHPNCPKEWKEPGKNPDLGYLMSLPHKPEGEERLFDGNLSNAYGE